MQKSTNRETTRKRARSLMVDAAFRTFPSIPARRQDEKEQVGLVSLVRVKVLMNKVKGPKT